MFAASAVVSACGVADTEAFAGFRADTLADARVVVSNPDRGLYDAGGDLRLVEDLRIGSAFGDAPGTLGNVHSLAVDRRGVIYVSDSQAQEVLVFDSAGAFVRNQGRLGGGPGEFRWFFSGLHLAWQPPDRLWVADMPTLSVVDSAGFPMAVAYDQLDLVYEPLRVDAVGFAYFGRRSLGLESGKLHISALMVPTLVVKHAVSEAGRVTAVDSLRLDQPEQVVAHRGASSDDGLSLTEIEPLPMQPKVVWTAGPSGSIWIANTSEYRLHELDFGGDTIRSVQLRREPEPLADAERDSLAAASGFDPAELPAHRPLLHRTDVAPEGTLWVRRPLPGTAWDVFDKCGRYLGRATSETRLEMDAFGVAKDDMDLEYVVRLRLRGPKAPSRDAAPC